MLVREDDSHRSCAPVDQALLAESAVEVKWLSYETLTQH